MMEQLDPFPGSWHLCRDRPASAPAFIAAQHVGGAIGAAPD
jgi:hypothetical protein